MTLHSFLEGSESTVEPIPANLFKIGLILGVAALIFLSLTLVMEVPEEDLVFLGFLKPIASQSSSGERRS